MPQDTRATDLVVIERMLRRMPADSVHRLARDVIYTMGRRNDALPEAATLPPDATSEEVSELAYALTSDEPTVSIAHVDGLFDRGLSLHAVYLGHLAPAARLLGDWWEENRLPFADVAIAAGRVFAILRRYRDLDPDPTIKMRHAVFAAVPGEVHRLGVQMAADLFADRGWSVRIVHEPAHRPLLEALRVDQSPVIGLSASGKHSLEPLIRLIVALKVARPTARVIVGGMIVNNQPRALRRLEPDGLVGDMATAQALLDRLEAMVAPSG